MEQEETTTPSLTEGRKAEKYLLKKKDFTFLIWTHIEITFVKRESMS